MEANNSQAHSARDLQEQHSFFDRFKGSQLICERPGTMEKQRIEYEKKKVQKKFTRKLLLSF